MKRLTYFLLASIIALSVLLMGSLLDWPEEAGKLKPPVGLKSARAKQPATANGTEAAAVPDEAGVAGADDLLRAFDLATSPDERTKAFFALLPLVSNEKAAELVERLPIGSEYDRGLQAVVEKLLASDVGFAKEWLLALPDNASTSAAFSAFGRLYAQTDLDDALEMGSRLEDKTKRHKFLAFAMQHFAATDPEGAQKWIEDRTDLFLSADLAYHALLTHAPLEFVDRHIGSLVADESVREQIRLTRGTIFPEERDADVAAPAAPDVDPEIAAFRAAARNDPVAASERLRDMPASPARDRMVSELAMEIASRQPAEAFVWAQSIADEELRFETARNVASRVTGEDISEAIRNSNFSDEQKEALLRFGR